MNLISQTHDKHILQSKQIREMVFSNILNILFLMNNGCIYYVQCRAGEGGGGREAEGTKCFHFLPHHAVFFDISPLDQKKKMTTPWS